MISVCIATYNGEKYIREQICSIASQLANGDEIIVSDDHSQDDTLKVIADLHLPIVRVVINEDEQGFAPNFQNALNQAKGDYIFLSDQDDVWKPNKVRVCMQALATHDFVISDAEVVDVSLHTIDSSYWHMRSSSQNLWMNLVRFSHIGCCLAFRREVLDVALPLPTNYRLCTHDNWIGLVGMAFFSCTFVNQPLICFRRHSANTSGATKKSTTTFYYKIAYRCYLVYHLLIRYLCKKRFFCF